MQRVVPPNRTPLYGQGVVAMLRMDALREKGVMHPCNIAGVPTERGLLLPNCALAAVFCASGVVLLQDGNFRTSACRGHTAPTGPGGAPVAQRRDKRSATGDGPSTSGRPGSGSHAMPARPDAPGTYNDAPEWWPRSRAAVAGTKLEVT